MNCAPLASTGLPILALIGVGGALLVGGVVLLLLARRGHARAVATIALLLVGTVLLAGVISL